MRTGVVYAFVAIARALVRGQVTALRRIRLTRGHYMSMALEFQVAADTVAITIAPTLDELKKLAITASSGQA